ncbi:unnamed protein product [Bursaphelenchus okinawaensis]|uniref:Pseudouridine synthase II N-terminal domain-containing protein n=1 Tax=Bursaphelenchus okinawaensis TaxID=465554 RepID=A0A811LSW0_9BILA|nr:unnamed protein product [Bursaphelenchus okinawaensis]CAG9127937.1 unnamed protein product [Bursaphelenchus okinawaensis]
MIHKFTARDVIRNLNGFLCVYKPRNVSLTALKALLQRRICAHGNFLIPEKPPIIQKPIVESHPVSGAPVVVGLRDQIDYAFHPLVNGGTFNPMDILLEELEPMEATTSGVCVFALNDGVDELEEVRDLTWVNEYHLCGKLGEATHKNELFGKIAAKATADHITPVMFKKLLTRLCFHYKRLSYELANVDMQSEEAFELARQGAARPRIIGSPVIYGLRLLKFDFPNFELQMNVVCENDVFLREFVHEIGCSMGSLARPTKIHRVRVGPLLRSHALLDCHFQLANILKNLKMTTRIIEMEKRVRAEPTVKMISSEQTTALLNDYTQNFDSLNKERRLAIADGIEDADDLRIPWGREYTKA